MVVGLTYSAPFRFPGASLAGLDMAQRDPYRILPHTLVMSSIFRYGFIEGVVLPNSPCRLLYDATPF